MLFTVHLPPSANFRVRKSASIWRISTWPPEQVMCLPWGPNRMKDLEFSSPRDLLTPGSQSCSSSAVTWRLLLIFWKKIWQVHASNKTGASVKRRKLPWFAGFSECFIHHPAKANMDLIAGNFLVGGGLQRWLMAGRAIQSCGSNDRYVTPCPANNATMQEQTLLWITSCLAFFRCPKKAYMYFSSGRTHLKRHHELSTTH